MITTGDQAASGKIDLLLALPRLSEPHPYPQVQPVRQFANGGVARVDGRQFGQPVQVAHRLLHLGLSGLRRFGLPALHLLQFLSQLLNLAILRVPPALDGFAPARVALHRQAVRHLIQLDLGVAQLPFQLGDLLDHVVLLRRCHQLPQSLLESLPRFRRQMQPAAHQRQDQPVEGGDVDAVMVAGIAAGGVVLTTDIAQALVRRRAVHGPAAVLRHVEHPARKRVAVRVLRLGPPRLRGAARVADLLRLLEQLAIDQRLEPRLTDDAQFLGVADNARPAVFAAVFVGQGAQAVLAAPVDDAFAARAVDNLADDRPILHQTFHRVRRPSASHLVPVSVTVATPPAGVRGRNIHRVQDIGDALEAPLVPRPPLQDLDPVGNLLFVLRADAHMAVAGAVTHRLAVGQFADHLALVVDEHAHEAIGRAAARPVPARGDQHLRLDHAPTEIHQVFMGLVVVQQPLDRIGQVELAAHHRRRFAIGEDEGFACLAQQVFEPDRLVRIVRPCPAVAHLHENVRDVRIGRHLLEQRAQTCTVHFRAADPEVQEQVTALMPPFGDERLEVGHTRIQFQAALIRLFDRPLQLPLRP